MSIIAGAVGSKAVFPDGAQIDHLSENTVGHGVAIQGRTDGTAVAMGGVGEVLYNYVPNLNCGSGVNVAGAFINLPAGIWNVYALAILRKNGATWPSSTLDAYVAINPVNDTALTNYVYPIMLGGEWVSSSSVTSSQMSVQTQNVILTSDGSNIFHYYTGSKVQYRTGIALYAKVGVGGFSGGPVQADVCIQAVRIA